MSVQVIKWVLEHSTAQNAERLVLISLANHAHRDGSNAFPSIRRIADEARCGESTVRLALANLTRSGAITEDGHGPRGVRRFSIVMENTAAVDRPVRKRPWQKVATPAGSAPLAPPQDLARPPQDLASPPQDLHPNRINRQNRHHHHLVPPGTSSDDGLVEDRTYQRAAWGRAA